MSVIKKDLGDTTTISVSRKNHEVLTSIARKNQSYDELLTQILTQYCKENITTKILEDDSIEC